jgi:nanoRNase/pAp phosphatase (c-di-AMP/oligoRNAs hydrolase)
MAVNASHFFTNDVGSEMARQSGTFGLVWKVDGTKVRCSLRAVAPYNLLSIAESMGGGGHPQAAAFTIDISDLHKFLKGEL